MRVTFSYVAYFVSLLPTIILAVAAWALGLSLAYMSASSFIDGDTGDGFKFAAAALIGGAIAQGIARLIGDFIGGLILEGIAIPALRDGEPPADYERNVLLLNTTGVVLTFVGVVAAMVVLIASGTLDQQ